MLGISLRKPDWYWQKIELGIRIPNTTPLEEQTYLVNGVTYQVSSPFWSPDQSKELMREMQKTRARYWLPFNLDDGGTRHVSNSPLSRSQSPIR